jgi:putative peptide zinc metalloprotease protein
MRAFVVAGLILGLLFVKLPFRTTVPVTLDVASRYQVTTASRGYVVAPPLSGVTDAGAVLLQLGNPALRDRLILARTDLAGSNLAYETVRGDDPAKAQAAQQAVATNEDQVVILETQNAGLALQAPRDGLFVPHRQLPVGTFLDSGSAIGAFFPDEGIAQFSGAFDERYYDKFQAGPDMITLRMAGSYYDLAIDDVRLQSTVTLDSQSGVRSYTLKASYAQAPSEIAHLPATIRVRFPPAPLWMHAQFMGQKIVANFRESQLLDRQKLLEN